MIAKLELSHEGFFPFKFDMDDDTGLMFNILRSFESLDIVHDKFGYYVSIEPINSNGMGFLLRSKRDTRKFKIKLALQFYKHMFSIKTQKNRKAE